jgi:serine/threonine-protein kinase HipA
MTTRTKQIRKKTSKRKAARRRGRYVPVRLVEVYLWGVQIGAVAQDPGTGFYAFNYTPEFRRAGIEPAPLHMPVSGGPYLFTTLAEATWRKLPAMLSDALPDDFGNALIDAYMAERGLHRAQVSPLDRLAYMGHRAMGALEFRPARGPHIAKATPIELSELVETARRAVHGHFDTQARAGASLKHIIDVGTSAGGARAKAVIAYNRATNEVRSGQFDAPDGFEHWLLKFDGMGRDRELGASQAYGRIEYAYSLMAKAAGIEMMPCELLRENGRAHFMTQRFDRGPDNTRYHQQTLCAMDHIDYRLRDTNSYAQLFVVLGHLSLPYGAREEVFRRMAFNVMARNCDDHTKNVSFRLRQGAGWELAPAYDVTFAHNPKGDWTNQHLMSVNGKFKHITEEDLLVVAARFGVGSAPAVLKQVRAAIGDWRHFAATAGLPDRILAEIGRQHQLLA